MDSFQLRLLLFCLTLGIVACNTDTSSRFSNQRDTFYFESPLVTIESYGATITEKQSGTYSFQCPAQFGINRHQNFPVFQFRANTLTPSIKMTSSISTQCEKSPPAGISIKDIPLKILDIYELCNQKGINRYLTTCPEDYTKVKSCDEQKTTEKTCALINEGTHKLILHSTLDDKEECIQAETLDRTPYSISGLFSCYACDAYDSFDIAAAIRANSPNASNCCAPDNAPTIELCLFPCPCKKLYLSIVPKKPSDTEKLKIAVFSDVESNTKTFTKLVNSIKENKVNIAVNLGNLSSSGKISNLTNLLKIYNDQNLSTDGFNCTTKDNLICCDENNKRTFQNFCNAILDKIPIISSIGHNEKQEEVLNFFTSHLSTPNLSTFIGNVQLLLIDSADATLAKAQKTWLENNLEIPKKHTCNIPAPNTKQWPMLYECASQGKSSCTHCIEQDAVCIPPDNIRSFFLSGPQNCICVPKTSKLCPKAQHCPVNDGKEHTCVCTRDTDCPQGGYCKDGNCHPPLRLVFTYTPLFDSFGARNNAFRSRQEAASILSRFAASNVYAVISGAIFDYNNFSMAGVKLITTGGAGAKLETFSKTGHHYLLITINNPYNKPSFDDVNVEVIKL